MNFKIWLIENFRTVTDFLLNPENSNKTWEELEKEFKESGGEILGSGKYGKVFYHPSWKYVLKMYNDPLYTSFVRFAFKNPLPAFPKFYGPPKKIIPQYKRYESEAISYIVRMEKLKPIDYETFELIDKFYTKSLDFFKNPEAEDTYWYYGKSKQFIYYGPDSKGNEPKEVKVKRHQELIDAIKDKPELFNILHGIYVLTTSSLPGSLDVHQNNFMKRDNGDIVFVDPFWVGSNPYRDAQMAIDREIDRHYSVKEPTLMGGKLPKRK